MFNLRFTIWIFVKALVCFHVENHVAFGTFKARFMPYLQIIIERKERLLSQLCLYVWNNKQFCLQVNTEILNALIMHFFHFRNLFKWEQIFIYSTFVDSIMRLNLLLIINNLSKFYTLICKTWCFICKYFAIKLSLLSTKRC